MSNLVSPYKILGVVDSTDDDSLKKRYKDLLLKYHPDHYSDKMEALYKTNLIIRAYKIITNERDNIKKLVSFEKNSYELQDNQLSLFLKYKDKSFLSMFEQHSDIYSIELNKHDFSLSSYVVTLHYYQLNNTFKKIYKQVTLTQKMLIKSSKKIILKQYGDFINDKEYKTLVIHLSIK